MNTLIVYDSTYGNTEKIAQVIEQSVRDYGKVRTRLANQFIPTDLDNIDVLFIGSPTQGGRPTKPVQAIVDVISSRLNPHVYIAAFDTRFNSNVHGVGLKLLMKIIGFAAPKITSQLKKKTHNTILPPKGFIVENTKGPLSHDELQRASSWAKEIVEARL